MAPHRPLRRVRHPRADTVVAVHPAQDPTTVDVDGLTIDVHPPERVAVGHDHTPGTALFVDVDDDTVSRLRTAARQPGAPRIALTVDPDRADSSLISVLDHRTGTTAVGVPLPTALVSTAPAPVNLYVCTAPTGPAGPLDALLGALVPNPRRPPGLPDRVDGSPGAGMGALQLGFCLPDWAGTGAGLEPGP